MIILELADTEGHHRDPARVRLLDALGAGERDQPVEVLALLLGDRARLAAATAAACARARSCSVRARSTVEPRLDLGEHARDLVREGERVEHVVGLERAAAARTAPRPRACAPGTGTAAARYLRDSSTSGRRSSGADSASRPRNRSAASVVVLRVVRGARVLELIEVVGAARWRGCSTASANAAQREPARAAHATTRRIPTARARPVRDAADHSCAVIHECASALRCVETRWRSLASAGFRNRSPSSRPRP